LQTKAARYEVDDARVKVAAVVMMMMLMMMMMVFP